MNLWYRIGVYIGRNQPKNETYMLRHLEAWTFWKSFLALLQLNDGPFGHGLLADPIAPRSKTPVEIPSAVKPAHVDQRTQGGRGGFIVDVLL